MAVVSRRTVLLLLLVLVLLSIAVRYPLVEHERFQTDSYTIHLLSKSIADNGHAKWAFHPLSYLGYYPFSYPSGVPFLLAEVSAMTGLDIEPSILFMNMVLGVLFCLGVFVLCRHFISKHEYVLLATLMAIMAARFVDTTYWDGSARGPMVVLVVLVIFAAFRAAAMDQRMLTVIAVVLGVGCFLTHHMAVLLVLFGLGYLLAAFQIQFLVRKIRLRKRAVATAWNMGIAVAIIVVTMGFFEYFKDLTMMSPRSASVFDMEPAALSIILNMSITYTNQIGFILLFAVFAVPALYRSARLSVVSVFPVTLVVAFMPLLANSLYVSMLLSPFIAVLGVSWIARQYRTAMRKKYVAVLLAVLIASSIALPFWSSNRWNQNEYVSGDTVEVDSRTYSDATYLKANFDEEYAIANVKITWSQLAAHSDARFLASGLQLIITGEVDADDIERNLSWSSARFPTNLYVWFEYTGEPSVDFYVQNLMVYGLALIAASGGFYTQARLYFSTHPKLVVAVDNNHENHYVGDYAVQSSALTSQLKEAKWQSNHPTTPRTYIEFDSYMTYQSGRTTFYLVELPV